MPAASAAFVRFAPFGAFVAALALRGALQDSAAFDARWLYGAQIAAAAALLLLFHRRYRELRDAPARRTGWILAGITGFAVFWIWIRATSPWMTLNSVAATFEPVGPAGELDWGLIALRLTGAVLVVPVVEELFWRSFLMRWIDRRDFLALPPGRSSLLALAASSAVFALAHPLWLAGLIAGLTYGWLYRITGSIWFPIIAHALTNLMLGIWVIDQEAWSFW